MVQDVGAEIIDGVKKAGQYAIRVDDEIVPLMSLPPGVFGKIETAYGWLFMRVLLNPIGRPDIAADLVDAAYRKCGKPPPPGLDEAGSIVPFFVELEADLPDPIAVEGGEANPTDAA